LLMIYCMNLKDRQRPGTVLNVMQQLTISLLNATVANIY